MGNRPLAIHELQILFKKYDRNEDSTLDQSECLALANEIAKREGAPPFTPQALGKVMNKFAGDDGKVNVREFEGAYMTLRNLKRQRNKTGATTPPRGARSPPNAEAAVGAPSAPPSKAGVATAKPQPCAPAAPAAPSRPAPGAQAQRPPPKAGAPTAEPQPSAPAPRSAGTPWLGEKAGAQSAKPQPSAPTPRSAGTPPGRAGTAALPPSARRAPAPSAAPEQHGAGREPSAAEAAAAAAKIQALHRGRAERQRLAAAAASPPAGPPAGQAGQLAAAAPAGQALLPPAGPRLAGPRPLDRQGAPAEALAGAAAPRHEAPSARSARPASPPAVAAPAGGGGRGGPAASARPPAGAGQPPGGPGAAAGQAEDPGLFGVFGLLGGWAGDEPEPVRARPKRAGPKRKRRAKAAAEPAPLGLDAALGQGFAALFGVASQEAEAAKPSAGEQKAEDEQQAQQAQQAPPQEEVETSVAVWLMVEGISHDQLLESRPMREEFEKGVKRAIIQQAENDVGPRDVRVTLQGVMVLVLIESPKGVAPEVLVHQLTSHVHALRYDIVSEVHRVAGIHAIASAPIRVTRLTIAGQAIPDEEAAEWEEGWLAGLFAPPRATSEHEADLEAVRRAAREGGPARPRPGHGSPAAARPRLDRRRPPSQQPATAARGGAWSAVAAANAAVRRRGSAPRAEAPRHRELGLPSPLLPWAPQLRQELGRCEAPRRSAGGGAASQRPPRSGRRGGVQDGEDPGARQELRELCALRAAGGPLPEEPCRELSEPESQESGESISGDVASSWNPAVHEHRYRYARDRAVGFSEPWGGTEWTVEDWERHLGASGALASPAQRRAREAARAQQRGRLHPGGAPAASPRGPSPGRSPPPQGGTGRRESHYRHGAAQASPPQDPSPAGSGTAQAARGSAAPRTSAARPTSGGGALGAAEAPAARPAAPAAVIAGGAAGGAAAWDDELLRAASEPLDWLSPLVLARHPLLADVDGPRRSWL